MQFELLTEEAEGEVCPFFTPIFYAMGCRTSLTVSKPVTLSSLFKLAYFVSSGAVQERHLEPSVGIRK